MDNPEISESGTKRWYLNGLPHRIYGPAIEYASGCKQWYVNGHRHRTDGPAVEFTDGFDTYWLNGQVYTFDEWLEKNTDLTHEQKVMMKLQYG
jgi:hypothetical protein